MADVPCLVHQQTIVLLETLSGNPGKVADALWRRQPAGGDVAPLLFPSCLDSARPQLSDCGVRSLPDTGLRDLTFTDRKSRRRERERDAQRIRWSDTHGEGRRLQPALLRRLPGSSVLTAENALLWLDLAGFGLAVGCGLVLTAVIVLLTPPPPPSE